MVIHYECPSRNLDTSTSTAMIEGHIIMCRTATAAVVADMGIPLDTASTRKLAPQQKEEGMKRLAEASRGLNDNRAAAAEVASGLSRTSIGREHREQVGPSVASTMGFPAPVSRR